VGRDIAKILGATTRRDGYFEGNGYCVTWTFGHLCTLKEPHDYVERWKHWSLGTIPMIPQRFGIKLINDSGIKKQFSVIEKLIGECERVINCGDAGQEGELIQRWVMQKASCSKPVERLWISSLTDEAIKEGFNHLRSSDDLQPLYIAGLCRAIGDWVLGINATRLYTLKYGQNRQVLSIGRVQTPTLALIVQRQKEIDNFVPKDSWELRTLYRGALFTADLPQFATKEEGDAKMESIRDAELQITDVAKKKGTEAPPRLFDLTSLQVECNKKFGMSADETLKTIQSLYEKKLATYPRVDTTYLTDDIYPKCGQILNNLPQYQNLLLPLRGKALKKSKKVFDNSKVTDHHAIIPTGQNPDTQALTMAEKNVFDTIAKRFISVFYPDCRFEQTVVKARVEKVNFKVTGKVILDAGWKVIYASAEKSAETLAPADGTDTAEDASQTLPVFTVGEHGPHKPELAKKTTQPPKYYTEGTLLKAMETAGNMVEDENLREALKANGIGRPSTRAAIIEVLFKRGYIRRERKSLRATQAGIDLISLIKEDLLKSAKLTGIWENRLRLIEHKQYDAATFIQQIKEMISNITVAVLSDNSNRRIEAQVEEPKSASQKSVQKSTRKPLSKSEKK
jgi:DNA topoisomerase-3